MCLGVNGSYFIYNFDYQVKVRYYSADMGKTIRQRFSEMTRLYHFTNFASACKIIESRKLKFGKMFRMNDLIESNRIVFDRLVAENEEDIKYNGTYAEREMHRYQQISFSQDRKYGDAMFLGFDLHTMWGLYADRGCGVCLVFDKDKLKLENGDYAKDVEYDSIIPADFGFRNKSKAGIKSEIWRRRDEIFFFKRKEWEYEQEYRVIRREGNEMDDEYLEVSDALSFAILCRDDSLWEGESIWSGLHYMEIKCIDKKLPLLSYEYGLDGYMLWREKPDDPLWTEYDGLWY